jgi:hypothetical protein
MGVEIGPSAPLPTKQPLTVYWQSVAGRMHPHEEREWQTRKKRIDGRMQTVHTKNLVGFVNVELA